MAVLGTSCNRTRCEWTWVNLAWDVIKGKPKCIMRIWENSTWSSRKSRMRYCNWWCLAKQLVVEFFIHCRVTNSTQTHTESKNEFWNWHLAMLGRVDKPSFAHGLASLVLNESGMSRRRRFENWMSLQALKKGVSAQVMFMAGSELTHQAPQSSQWFPGFFNERLARRGVKIPPAWFHWSLLFVLNLEALYLCRTSCLGCVSFNHPVFTPFPTIGCTGLLQFVCAHGCRMQIPIAAEHDLKMNMSLTSPFVACPCCYCSQLKAEAEHVDTFCIQWFPLRVRAACSQFRGPKRQPWVEDNANI